MFPAGLATLLRLRTSGFFRRLGKGIRDPRKAVVLVAMYGGSVLAVGVFGVFRVFDEDFGTLFSGDVVSLFLFAAVFLVVVSSLFDFPIAYSPPEVQFLFPAPFSRRGLLAYKFVQFLPIVLVVAFIGATVLVGFVPQWVAAFVGTFVFSYLVLVLGVVTGLLGQTPTLRLLLGLGVLAVTAYAVYDIGRLLPELNRQFLNGRFEDSVSPLYESRAFRAMIVSAGPIYAMIYEPIASRAFLVAFSESTGCLAVLFVLAFALDTGFHEVALNASAKREARIARVLRGQSMRGASAIGTRIRLPSFPRFGGAGPIARRYGLALVRENSTLWILLIAIVTPASVAAYLRMQGDTEILQQFRWFMVGGPIYLTFIVVNIVRFDFRADYVVLDYLKTLPVRPIPFATGGVIASAMYTTLIQIVPSVVYAVVGNTEPAPLRFLFLLLPANFMWFALDNAFYLRAPTPMRKGMQADPGEMARQLLSVLVRGAILFGAFTVVGGVYALVRMKTGSIALATASAWFVILPLAAWSAYLAGIALRDLDLSRDAL